MADINTTATAPAQGTPLWWLMRLDKKLAERCTTYETLERYYRGDHPLPEGDDRARELFRKFQRKARTNYMRLVANSITERLEIVGFRTGGPLVDDAAADAADPADVALVEGAPAGPDTADDADVDGSDDDAWQIWQANHLDSDSGMVHDAAAKFSDAYVIIGPADNDSDDPEDNPAPLITGEDPREVIAETDPVNRRVVRAAAKIWTDDYDAKRHAVLFLPDAFHYFVEDAPAQTPQQLQSSANAAGYQPPAPPPKWIPELVNDEGSPADDPDADPADTLPENAIANPIAPTIPVVRFITNPDLKGQGMGEFEDVIDIQDRINDTIMNRLVIGKMQAYRQRWAKGIQTEDEDGNELPLPFVPGVDLLWAVEETDAQFGDFAQSDLGPLLDAVKADVQAIVTLTGLPPHYVQGDIVNASADALAAAESRLVSKVRARQRQYGESWEQVLRIAFTYLGQPNRIKADAEVQWADPERKSVAQLADAAVKKETAGVPWRQRMEDLDYTPTQIKRMRAERAQEAAAPAPALPAPPAPPDPAMDPVPAAAD